MMEHRRAFLTLLPLALLLSLWLWFVYASGALIAGPNGEGEGSDFAMFWAASRIQQAGFNPYDPPRLYGAERRLLLQDGVTGIANRPLVRVGNPPLFFWALRPLAAARFGPATVWWMAAMAVVLVVGWVLLLIHLKWSRKLVSTLIFLAMPQSVLAIFYGNITALFFTMLAASIALAGRFPALAGAITAIGWLKPQLALPFVLLIALFHTTSARRYIGGFLAASLVLGLTGLIVLGVASYRHWVTALLGYSSNIAAQPHLASLTGMYSQWAPTLPRLVFELAQAGVALLLTAIVFRRRGGRGPHTDMTAPLWFAWFLAVPYAHYPDEVVLAFPVLSFFSSNGASLRSRLTWLVPYLLFFSIFVFNLSPHGIQLGWLPLLLVAVIMWRTSIAPTPQGSRLADALRNELPEIESPMRGAD